MEETRFYLGIEIHRRLKLDECFLIIDNYYEAIQEILLLFVQKGYDKMNCSLLDAVAAFIDEYCFSISEILTKRKAYEKLRGNQDGEE